MLLLFIIYQVIFSENRNFLLRQRGKKNRKLRKMIFAAFTIPRYFMDIRSFQDLPPFIYLDELNAEKINKIRWTVVLCK